MNLINLGSDDNQIIFKVDSVEDGIAVIHMTIPFPAFRGLHTALSGLSDLLRYMEVKTTHFQLANRHVEPERIAEREKFKRNLANLVYKSFDKHIAKGLTPAEAVSAANRELKDKGYESLSYGIVQRLCRESGRLRKKK